MKNLLIICLLLITTTQLNGTSIENYLDELNVSGQVIYSSDKCVIIRSFDENGNPIHIITSEIFNVALPKVVNHLCRVTTSYNEEVCQAVADALDLLVSLSSVTKSSKRLVRNIIGYQVKRESEKSKVYFWTKSLEIAQDAKNLIEAYDKLGRIKWTKIDFNSSVAVEDAEVDDIWIQNDTSDNLSVLLSYDGIKWEIKSISSGHKKYYRFGEKKNGSKSYHSYGFMNLNQCVSMLKTNRKYTISFNKNTNTYEVEESL